MIESRFPSSISLADSVSEVFSAPVDTVIFGHTHYAVAEEHQGILLINPGSPSLPRMLRKLGQVAILEVSNGKRDAKIIELSNYS